MLPLYHKELQKVPTNLVNQENQKSQEEVDPFAAVEVLNPSVINIALPEPQDFKIS